jgi:hypothetical protein
MSKVFVKEQYQRAIYPLKGLRRTEQTSIRGRSGNALLDRISIPKMRDFFELGRSAIYVQG